MKNHFVRCTIVMAALLSTTEARPSPAPSRRRVEDALVAARCTTRDGRVHTFNDAGVRMGDTLTRYVTVVRQSVPEQIPLAEVVLLTVIRSSDKGVARATIQRSRDTSAQPVDLVVRQNGAPLLLSSTRDRAGDLPLFDCRTIAFAALEI
jgi:hypothetical protein